MAINKLYSIEIKDAETILFAPIASKNREKGEGTIIWEFVREEEIIGQLWSAIRLYILFQEPILIKCVMNPEQIIIQSYDDEIIEMRYGSFEVWVNERSQFPPLEIINLKKEPVRVKLELIIKELEKALRLELNAVKIRLETVKNEGIFDGYSERDKKEFIEYIEAREQAINEIPLLWRKYKQGCIEELRDNQERERRWYCFFKEIRKRQ